MDIDYVDFEIAEDLSNLCQRPLIDCADCMECWIDKD